MSALEHDSSGYMNTCQTRTFSCNQDSSFLVGRVNGQTPEIVTPVAVTPDVEAT